MAHTRKRAAKERSSRAASEQKKSKPSDSVSSGGSVPDEHHLSTTDHKTIIKGENGSINETECDSHLGNGNCTIEEGFAFDGRKIKEEDQSTLCENIETYFASVLNHKANHAGLQKTAKEEEDVPEEKLDLSRITKQLQNQPPKMYTCECGKSYTRNSNLNRHRKMSHVGHHETSSGGGRDGEPCEVKTSEKAFLCTCGKSFTLSSNLSRHQKTCQPCAKITVKSEADESLSKPYVCNCGKRYTCSSHLYRHQRSVDDNHEGAKTFICDCGKPFSCRSHLITHQKTHTQAKTQAKVKAEERGGDLVEPTKSEAEDTEEKIKPYVCQCGKGYTSSSHLYRHQRSHKEGEISTSTRNRPEESQMEKPFKCQCGKSYTCMSHLNRHQRSHMEQDVNLDYDSDGQYEEPFQKPYQCECGKSFILWFSLMVHKKIHCKLQSSSTSNQNS